MTDPTNVESRIAMSGVFLVVRILRAISRVATDLLENNNSTVHIVIASTLSKAFQGKIIASDTFENSMGVMRARSWTDDVSG